MAELKLRLFITALLLTAFFISGEVPKPESTDDSLYYMSYDSDLIIQPSVSSRMFFLNFSSSDSESTSIEYRPNVPLNLGMQASYKQWGISASYGLLNGRDSTKYGETDYQDINLTYYSDSWGLDTYYMRYKGYYISNTSDLVSSPPENGVMIQQGDMECYNIGADFFYTIAGDNFSLKSAFKNSAVQLKRAGAMMLMTSYNYISFSNDKPLIPEEQISYYGQAAAFSESSYHSVSLLPGFGYSFVLSHFYFTPVIFAGPAYQWQSYETLSKDARDYSVSSETIKAQILMMKYNIRLATGMNFNNFYCGFHAYLDVTDIANPKENLQMSATVLDATLFGGIRL